MRRARIIGVLLTVVILAVGVIFTVRQSGLRLPAEIVMMTAVVPGCGNEIIESDEECDGVALAGATCASKGFSGGVLSCTRSCFYNVTACTNASSSRGVNTSSHIVFVAEENRTQTLFRSATEFARYYMRHLFGY